MKNDTSQHDTASSAAGKPARHSARGFTLVELMLVSVLVGMIAMASGTILWQVSSARKRFDGHEQTRAQADAALHAITTAIANAYRPGNNEPAPLVGEDAQVNGLDADTLRLMTVSHKVIRPGQPEADVHCAEFKLAATADERGMTLIRRTDPTRNTPDDEGGVVDALADRFVMLNFEYFDGVHWRDEWPESEGRMPVAVRVTVVLGDDDGRGRNVSYSRMVAPARMAETRSSGGGPNG